MLSKYDPNSQIRDITTNRVGKHNKVRSDVIAWGHNHVQSKGVKYNLISLLQVKRYPVVNNGAQECCAAHIQHHLGKYLQIVFADYVWGKKSLFFSRTQMIAHMMNPSVDVRFHLKTIFLEQSPTATKADLHVYI